MMLTSDNGQLPTDSTHGHKSTHNSMRLPLLHKEKLTLGAPSAIRTGVTTPTIAQNSQHPLPLPHPGHLSCSSLLSALLCHCHHFLLALTDILMQGHLHPNNQALITASCITKTMATARMASAALKYICALSARKEAIPYHNAPAYLHDRPLPC
jgi:hypothetical protein